MHVMTFEFWRRNAHKQATPHSDQSWDISQASTMTNTPEVTPQISRMPSPTREAKDEAMRRSEPLGNPKISSRITEDLAPSWMTCIIVLCFFVSGMIDAVSFNSWNCFVGMQSGNTIFIALGVSHLPASAHRHQYLKSLTAVGSFCLGTILFNILHRCPTGLATAPTSRRRWNFTISFLLQTIFVIVAAALVTTDVVSNQSFRPGIFSSGSQNNAHNDTNYHDLIPVALLSFQAAGQVCLSRNLNVIELPTIVVSTLYHDFVADVLATQQSWEQADRNLWRFLRKTNLRQEKRLFSIVALFLGAFAGGEMYKGPARMAGALWLAAGLKGGIFLALLVWPADRRRVGISASQV